MSDAISIVKLLNERNQMADLLCRIAYPRRGTPDEQMGIYDATALIQGVFSILDLEPVPVTPDSNLENLDAAHARMWHAEAMRLAAKHNEDTFYHSRRDEEKAA